MLETVAADSCSVQEGGEEEREREAREIERERDRNLCACVCVGVRASKCESVCERVRDME